MTNLTMRVITTQRFEVVVPTHGLYAPIGDIDLAKHWLIQKAAEWNMGTSLDDWARAVPGDDEIIFYIERNWPVGA